MPTYKVYVEEVTTYEFTLKAQDADDAIWNTQEKWEQDDFDPDKDCTNVTYSGGDGLHNLGFSAVKISS